MISLMSLLCVITELFSNGQKVTGKDWVQVTKVVYCHHDASVAPDYYRSYKVTVTESNIEVAVSNYSETLLTKQFPMTAADFKRFVGKLQDTGVKKVKEKVSAATGCTSESLELYKGSAPFFSGYKTCGGGNLKLARGRLSTLIEECVPGLEELVEQTRGHESQ